MEIKETRIVQTKTLYCVTYQPQYNEEWGESEFWVDLSEAKPTLKETQKVVDRFIENGYQKEQITCITEWITHIKYP